jgi:hypothetical protein
VAGPFEGRAEGAQAPPRLLAVLALSNLTGEWLPCDHVVATDGAVSGSGGVTTRDGDMTLQIDGDEEVVWVLQPDVREFFVDALDLNA